MTALTMDVRELSNAEVDQIAGAVSLRDIVVAAGATAGGAVGSLFGSPWLVGPAAGVAAGAYYDWLDANPGAAAAYNQSRVNGPAR